MEQTMIRKESWTVSIKIGEDYFAKKCSSQYFAECVYTRLASTDYEVALIHNREDGMDCRLDIRAARNGGF
jgi:hypothetical protein